jgi:hypothetical protein
MRLGRRAQRTRTATPPAGAQLPLRAQALVPFAVSLALVVALAAVGTALIARQAVDREMRSQAQTARVLVDTQLREVGRRMAAETAEMRDDARRRSGRALQDRLIAFSQREALSLAAVVDDGRPAVGDGRLAWTSLPFARRLLQQARSSGKPSWGTARSDSGEPLVIAAAWGGRGRGVLAGRTVDRGLLSAIERSTDVLVRLETVAGAPPASPPGTRSFESPPWFSDGPACGCRSAWRVTR